MGKAQRVGVGDGATVDAYEGDEAVPEIVPPFPLGYHQDKAWAIAHDDRGWRVTADGYNDAAMIKGQQFFDTEAEAVAARMDLIALVGGVQA